MPLGTLDHTPPPFFRQGPSALTQLVVLAALAVFLMVADARFTLVAPLRAALATALLPVQRTLMVPVELVSGGGAYLGGLQRSLSSEHEARAALLAQAVQAARADALAAENAQLRALLDLRPALPVRTLTAEVLFEARDPYSRKLVVDRGETHGVQLGAPAVLAGGVLGQVTRLYPLSAEVSLLTDREAAIPVLLRRTLVRGIAFGGVRSEDGDAMELRFVSANADIEAGDLLETSGIDGLYPPGLPVAQVKSVERRVESGFARVLLTPATRAAGTRHLLLLEPISAHRPVRPEETTAPIRPRARR